MNNNLTKKQKIAIKKVYDDFIKIMMEDFLPLCQLLDNIDVSFVKDNNVTAGIMADKENNISIIINYFLVSKWNSHKLLFIILHELFHYLRGDIYDTPDFDAIDNGFSDCIINYNIVKIFKENEYLKKNIPLTMRYDRNIKPHTTYMSLRQKQNEIINKNLNVFMDVDTFFNTCDNFIHYPVTVQDQSGNIYDTYSFQSWNLFFKEKRIIFHNEKKEIPGYKILYNTNKKNIKKDFFLVDLNELKKRKIEKIKILKTSKNENYKSSFKKSIGEKVTLKTYSPKNNFVEEDCIPKEFSKINSTNKEFKVEFIKKNKGFAKKYLQIDSLKKGSIEKPFLIMSSLRKYFPDRERHKTWKKMNRRTVHRGEFQKGYKWNKLQEIVICVDTSGSVFCKEYFSKVLYVINKSFDDYIIKLVLNDEKIRSVKSYRKTDYNKIKMIGDGGTCFNEFFNHWMPKNYPSDYKNIPVFVFTDMCFEYSGINKKKLTNKLTFIIPHKDYETLYDYKKDEINEYFNTPNLVELR